MPDKILIQYCDDVLQSKIILGQYMEVTIQLHSFILV